MPKILATLILVLLSFICNQSKAEMTTSPFVYKLKDSRDLYCYNKTKIFNLNVSKVCVHSQSNSSLCESVKSRLPSYINEHPSASSNPQYQTIFVCKDATLYKLYRFNYVNERIEAYIDYENITGTLSSYTCPVGQKDSYVVNNDAWSLDMSEKMADATAGMSYCNLGCEVGRTDPKNKLVQVITAGGFTLSGQFTGSSCEMTPFEKKDDNTPSNCTKKTQSDGSTLISCTGENNNPKNCISKTLADGTKQQTCVDAGDNQCPTDADWNQQQQKCIPHKEGDACNLGDGTQGIRDKNLNCIKKTTCDPNTQTCPDTQGNCPTGTTKQSDGTCKKDANACDPNLQTCPDTQGNCPTGTTKQTNGTCKKDQDTCDPNLQDCSNAPCPAGQQRQNGQCVLISEQCDPAKQTCTDDKGNCPTGYDPDPKNPKSCLKKETECDPTKEDCSKNGECATLDFMCKLEKKVNESGEANLDGVKPNGSMFDKVTSVVNVENRIQFSGQCPAPRTFTIWKKTFHLKYDQFCKTLSQLSVVFVAIAYLASMILFIKV